MSLHAQTVACLLMLSIFTLEQGCPTFFEEGLFYILDHTRPVQFTKLMSYRLYADTGRA